LEEEEPSIYFYEDDEDELETLVTKCLPILKEFTRQIDEFDTYNNIEKFKKEQQFDHTLIIDDKANKRSSIGLSKIAKKQHTNRSQKEHSQATTTQEYLNGFDISKMQETVTGMLGVKRYEDWILNLNIGNVMHLSPLGLQEMNLQLDNSHELTRDAILEKIVLLSISYFCVGTELRFLSQNKAKAQEYEDKVSVSDKYDKGESEKWQAKAVETSCTFLPSECPLVGHVISSYQKHHSIINEAIPEDKELDENFTFIRPLNEVKQDSVNYHQIIK
jgi:F0F1-type ATP synthase assembly protein I